MAQASLVAGWGRAGIGAMTMSMACLASLVRPTVAEDAAQAELQHQIDSWALLIFVMLLIATTLLIWMFKTRRIRGLHETGVAMLMGVAAGVVIDQATPSSPHHACNRTVTTMDTNQSVESEAIFDPELFFFVLLPPIIFFAGYDLKQKHFFRNISSILAFAFLGTTIACFMTGGLLYMFDKHIYDVSLTLVECLLFGAIISATDPVTVLAIYHDLHVDHNLYALVFGESVLNDAVALVLYQTLEKFQTQENVTMQSFFHALWVFTLIFCGSLAVGCFIGMVTAIIMKFTSIQKLPLVEQALFALLSYSTFLIGEAGGLSGIVAVLFCGITQAHYTFGNLSEESKTTTKTFFGLVNFLAENFIFSYIGLSFFTYKCHKWDVGFIIWSLVTIVVSRAAMIYPISFLINAFKSARAKGIPMAYQHCLVFAGLRGAIAFALAMRGATGGSDGRRMILSTTLVIVLVTVIFFGGGTVSVLQQMKIRVGVSDDDEVSHPPQGGMVPVGDGATGPKKSWIARVWQGFDRKYIKAVLGPEYSPGVDKWASVVKTVQQYMRGQPETYDPPSQSPEHDHRADDGDDSSDDDTDASSELLDFSDDDDGEFDADAVSGDIGRASQDPPRQFAGFEPMDMSSKA
eukprot:m.182468 g.182468  ORF g.182468 m.182468 type:complete len:632 (+) comp15536_c0_seq1:261-2156(+)